MCLSVCLFVWHKSEFYRVAQNKPDYLLLLSKFCISTRKHVNYDNVRVAPRTLVKAVLNVCPPPVATTSDNRLRSCPIARSIMPWPICSQQVCTTSFLSSTSRIECDDDGKLAVGVLPRCNNLLGLSLAIRRPLFWLHKFWHTKTHLLSC